MTNTQHSFFAPCARGLEPLLAEELRRLGAASVRPVAAGVSFAGSLEVGLRTCLWSRIASRVLLRLATVPCGTADAFYEAVREIPWEEHLDVDGTLAVDAVGVNDALRNTQFTAVRAKDAIADRFRDRTGRRPSVDVYAPDLLLNVRLRGDTAALAIDLSGDPLHRRGYRAAGAQVLAPLKETLAAGVLATAGWANIAHAGGAFIDPMCGSGTLAIEAALMAGDVAPGLTRARWGFSAWGGRDEELWDRLVDEADLRAEEGLERLPVIRARDVDPEAVGFANACVAAAGLKGRIEVSLADVAILEPPKGYSAGLVACNPPYGERLGDVADLPALYATLAGRLHAAFGGWTVATVTSDPAIGPALGLPERRVLETFNGRIPVTVRVFGATEPPSAERGRGQDRGAGRERERGRTERERAPKPGAPRSEGPLPAVDVEPFANRLRKMARHREKWARRTGVSCYRVYDADLPDFNIAVDLYHGADTDAGTRWAHVAEYAPPRDVDLALADARLHAAITEVSRVLGVPERDVFLKVRERQRGANQYERVSRRGVVGIVSESGLLFEVNLSDYLDTGLFLDHRDTRAWLAEMAEGSRFLNLFAYTGTATVYAAAGGAHATTTVDLSATYLAWAQRNLERNGFSAEDVGGPHRFVRADVREWLKQAAAEGERYDLVFCDPPTFSTSKRMDGTLDVQRDHVQLITDCAAVLDPVGLLVFSCNKRGFSMDVSALAEQGLVARDITARTLPEDFERTPGVHSVWTVRHAEDQA